MTIELLIISFMAGVLTVLTPCTFTLLPVILAGSLEKKNLKRPFVIILSLALSLIVFTLILRATTALINVPSDFWKLFSGGLLVLLGLANLFPEKWNHVSSTLHLSRSEKLLDKSKDREGLRGGILAGFALGPVFTSCSPTYLLILSTVLPQEFLTGLVYLLVYTLGLSSILAVVAVLGQKIVSKLKWTTNPQGKFRKIIGTVFIIIGLLIIFGIDKRIEAILLQSDFVNNLINFEWGLLKK